MFCRFALDGEIGIGQSAGVGVGKPTPDENAADSRSVENRKPVRDHLCLQRRIGRGFAFFRAFPRLCRSALGGAQPDLADDD